MNATEVPAAGAGLLRRLRRHAGDVVFLIVALVAGFFLWPSSLGGCTTLTIVAGHSMEPTYYTGDLVVSRCGEYQVGDIVVYNPPNVGAARVIHRIIGGDGEAGWVIQGDNNDFLDPWQPTNERILGKAVLHLPKVGLLGSILVSPLTWVSLLWSRPRWSSGRPSQSPRSRSTTVRPPPRPDPPRKAADSGATRASP